MTLHILTIDGRLVFDAHVTERLDMITVHFLAHNPVGGYDEPTRTHIDRWCYELIARIRNGTVKCIRVLDPQHILTTA